MSKVLHAVACAALFHGCNGEAGEDPRPSAAPVYDTFIGSGDSSGRGDRVAAAEGMWSTGEFNYHNEFTPYSAAWLTHHDQPETSLVCEGSCAHERAALPGDVNGDGTPDWVLGDASRLVILPSTPGVELSADLEAFANLPRITADSVASAEVVPCGDVSGDGLGDLCLAGGIWRGPLGDAPDLSWVVDDQTLGAAGIVDGTPTLFVSHAGGVARVDGQATGVVDFAVRPTWAAPGRPTALAMADLDGDGEDSLIAVIGQEIHAVAEDLSGSEVLFVVPDGEPGPLVTGDVDGDGRDEVIVGARPKLWVLDDDGAVLEWWYGPTQGFAASLAMADIDLDGVLELVVGGADERVDFIEMGF